MSDLRDRALKSLELTVALAELHGHDVVVLSGDSFRANLNRTTNDPRGPQTIKQKRVDRESEMRKAHEVGIPEVEIYAYLRENFPELLYKKRSPKLLSESWVRRCYRKIIAQARAE
jgi:hypothetical protein